mgnify:FL=1
MVILNSLMKRPEKQEKPTFTNNCPAKKQKQNREREEMTPNTFITLFTLGFLKQ